MLYVTHDQVEAMTMAQSVAVLSAGRLLQEAAPMTLYRDPASLEVARFIGSPSINTVRGRTTGAAFVGALEYATTAAAGDAVLAVRPEHLAVGARASGGAATVTMVEALGPESLVRLRLGSGEELVARVGGETASRTGDEVGVSVLAGQGLLFRAGDGTRLR